MPWYWILIILSAIFGPFEAMHALNKARKRREEMRKKKRGNKEKGGSVEPPFPSDKPYSAFT